MKRLIVLLAAMLVSSAASAQLLLGVEGGLSVNNYSKDNGLDCNGWKVGAYVGYTFRSHWQLQSGIGYYGNRMGSVKDWSDLSDFTRAEVYKNTLTVPVTVGYKIGGRFVSVTPKVGLYVGFGHNAKTFSIGDITGSEGKRTGLRQPCQGQSCRQDAQRQLHAHARFLAVPIVLSTLRCGVCTAFARAGHGIV